MVHMSTPDEDFERQKRLLWGDKPPVFARKRQWWPKVPIDKECGKQMLRYYKKDRGLDPDKFLPPRHRKNASQTLSNPHLHYAACSEWGDELRERIETFDDNRTLDLMENGTTGEKGRKNGMEIVRGSLDIALDIVDDEKLDPAVRLAAIQAANKMLTPTKRAGPGRPRADERSSIQKVLKGQ